MSPLSEEDQPYWESSLHQCGLSNEQVEKIFREFGNNELARGNRLNPWNGYVTRSGSCYELRGQK